MKHSRAMATKAKQGLSLVEIMIALGLLSFTLIPVIGLLAIGLSTYRSAMDTTVNSAILQHIRTVSAEVSAAQQHIPDTYYTDEGMPVGQEDPRALFRAGHDIGQGQFIDGEGDSAPLGRTFINRYTIIHLPSEQTSSSGVIHVTPRE